MSLYLQWVIYSQFGRVVLLKVSHEVTEIGYSSNWHSVVHRESDTWVESVSSNLDDFCFSSFSDEKFFKLFVTTSYSHNDVNSASPFWLNFGRVETTRSVDGVPKHSASLRGGLSVILETTVLVHVRNVQSGDVHWEDCWGIVVSIWRFFMKGPVTHNWNILIGVP
jgi:hypothetical protein